MAIPWDNETIIRTIRRNKNFNAGDDLTQFKALVAKLPSTAPEDAVLDLTMTIRSTKHLLNALIASFPDTVPEGVDIMIDFMLNTQAPLAE